MKALIFVALINIQLFQTAGSLIAGGCRPPDYQVFTFDCAQNQDVWVQDALFGVITDGGALRNFCDDAAPNRTTECIPQRPIDTRNIRLACNAVRGQCKPSGPNEMMHSNTFDSCPQTRSFTYGYAVYDCLPALRTTDGVAMDFVYVSPSSLPKSSYEKIYLASSNYDSKGYTTLPVNQCSVKVSSAVLSMVRFTVLDLLGQTTDGSAVSCPYTLSVSGAGISKDWLACSTWNNYDVYQLNISANSATHEVTLSVSFNAAGGSTAAQGRFWILVEGITTDGTGSTIEISSGLTSSSTSTTTTPTTTTTTPTTTTTTTTSTTTTTPTTTTTTSTTTTTTPSTTTTTRTPTTTSTTTTSIIVTPRMTPSSSATTITPTSSTTTTTTTPTTTTQSTTPSTTASTTSISSTTTRSTTATIFSPPVVPPSSTGTMTPSMSPTTDHQTTGNSSASSNSSAVEPDSDSKTSSRVVAIAVGASVAGAVLLFTAVIVIICLCMYCAKKKRKSKPRAPQPVPESVHSGSVASIHAISPAATIARPSSPGVGGGGDDIYSEINESRIDITITGTMNPKNPATVGHQFSLRYTVGGGAGSGGEVSSGGHGHKDRHNVYVHKRMKGRPPQLDEEQWEDEPEVDSPPPYSSDGRRTEPTGQRPSNKRSRWGKSKLYVPPGESGESDTDVQHNPLYGMGLEGGRAGTRSEDYNY